MTDDKFLSFMPGNILSSHGRSFTQLIGFRFYVAGVSQRSFIRTIPHASAASQAEAAARFRAEGGPGDLFISVFLAASAYRRCKITPERTPPDVAFQLGMQYASRHRLGDPPPEGWDSSYRDESDLAILLAHDDPTELETAAKGMIGKALEAGFTISFRERGAVMRSSSGLSTEIFGFADGISQPPLSTINEIVNTALVPDPGYKGGWGSYVVYRKIRQDPNAFMRSAKLLSTLADVDENKAASLIVGRFRDGTPTQFSSSANLADNNDFNYANDPDGFLCPLGSHIRRMNPRLSAENARRIIRRGIPYKNNIDAGLLFLAYQQDITRQFEHLQGIWGIGRDGITDPILAGKHGSVFSCQSGQEAVTVQLPQLTKLQGGAYWFAPSPQSLADWP